MIGPCMCGAFDCHSCGPAQGSYKCPLCGEWGGGCEHYDEATGEPTAEALAAWDRMKAAEDDAIERYIEEQNDVDRMIERHLAEYPDEAWHFNLRNVRSRRDP